MPGPASYFAASSFHARGTWLLGALLPGHPGYGIGFERFDDEIGMIGHQEIGMHLAADFMAGFGQDLEKIVLVDVIWKNALAAIISALIR